MSELFFLTSVADRRMLTKYVSVFKEKRISTSFITLGRGTVAGSPKNLFVDRTEKAVLFSLVTRETWKALKRELNRKLLVDLPGAGVSFIVPMSSIGGRRELEFLTEGQDFVRGEESVMKGTVRELLVVICNQGYNEMVMDAAREGGANGGTVINARGTGMERAEKFLGISLASEKEMVFIVVRSNIRDRVMQSIMLKAGVETEAKGIVFSLPVTDAAGLRLAEEEEEEKKPQEPDTQKEE